MFHADTHGNNSNGLADGAGGGCDSEFSLLGCNLKKEEESEGELTACITSFYDDNTDGDF